MCVNGCVLSVDMLNCVDATTYLHTTRVHTSWTTLVSVVSVAIVPANPPIFMVSAPVDGISVLKSKRYDSAPDQWGTVASKMYCTGYPPSTRRKRKSITTVKPPLVWVFQERGPPLRNCCNELSNVTCPYPRGPPTASYVGSADDPIGALSFVDLDATEGLDNMSAVNRSHTVTGYDQSKYPASHKRGGRRLGVGVGVGVVVVVIAAVVGVGVVVVAGT